MTIAPSSSNFYKVGGSLGVDHPSYVIRKADHALLDALNRRQFCYVFNCRQMGKSSLRVRAIHLLKQEGMGCVSIDMTMLGSQINPQQWYGGIISQLFQGFSLLGKVNLKAWMQESQILSPVQQLERFITDVLLPNTGEQPLFIFIDEIDKTLSLDFSVDDFFALIRFFYNQRAEDPRFNRVTFALFGVATPSDLIQNKTQTLFNIGHAIELMGFSQEEVYPLAAGLENNCDRPQVILEEILNWSGGQPFLTQKLCHLAIRAEHRIATGEEAQQIEQIVSTQIVNNWEAQDEPVHFKTIRDRLLRHPPQIARQLGLYRQILSQGYNLAEAGPAQTELRLSGLIVQREGQLQVYNRIYSEIFNLTWIEQQLAQVRPYAEALNAWESSKHRDESRLLRGQALIDALRWSEGKSLSQDDYRFLTASQDVDKRTALEQERRRQDLEHLELKLAAEQKAKEELSHAYAKAKKRLQIAALILVGSVIGAAIATGWLGYVLRRQQATQIESLAWAGKGSMSQFDFSQLDALITAMDAGQQLQSLIKHRQPLQDYPTASPIDALQTILDGIRERNYLIGHEAPINGISISPNNEFIATASRDGTARIWRRDGSELKALSEHVGGVYGISFSPDSQKLATSSNDGTAKIWTVGGELLQSLEHPSAVYNVRFSPDGQWIATASKDGYVRIWQHDGRLQQSFQAHQSAIYSIEFKPDSTQILTASEDGTARVIRLDDGKVLRTLESSDILYAASFSPDGQRIAIAGETGVVELWNETKLEALFEGHQDAIYDVSFEPSGNFIATTSEDETVKIWSVTGQPIETLQGYKGAVYDASFNPQGTMLVTASHEKEAKIWDFSRNNLAPRTQEIGDVAAFRLSQTGNLITAYTSGYVMIETSERQMINQFQVEGAVIYDIELHPNKDQIFIAFEDGKVELWDFLGNRLKEFQAHEDIIYSIAVHARLGLIATGSRDKTVKLWTFDGGEKRVFEAQNDAVYDVQFSPDGRWMATASSDGTANLWTLDGQRVATFIGHLGAIHQIEFSPDSRYLATASTDETVRLWTVAGTTKFTLEHNSGLVFRVGFSPDGKIIATGSKDGSISLWDFDGQLLDQLKSHQSLIMDLYFNAENQLVSIAQTDSRPRLWPQSPSAASRLNYLLQDGCYWLQDYFKWHPQREPTVCQQLSKGV